MHTVCQSVIEGFLGLKGSSLRSLCANASSHDAQILRGPGSCDEAYQMLPLRPSVPLSNTAMGQRASGPWWGLLVLDRAAHDVIKIGYSESGNPMKLWLPRFVFLPCVWCACSSLGAIHYVDVNGKNAVPPYTDWSTAATNIQQAVDAADPGDQVLVTNGVYKTGGRPANGLLTNRVAVTKPVTIQSINGPLVTSVKGYQDLVSGTAMGAVRCVYLTNGAVLSGFTLNAGGTRSSGGSTNDLVGGGAFCESTNAILTNCIIAGNWSAASSYGGGGSYSGTVIGCTLTNNEANTYGGAAYQSVLTDCLVISNLAQTGEGVAFCRLDHCRVIGNQRGSPFFFSSEGGGAYRSSLNSCILSGNSADTGGAASASTLINCLVLTNSAVSRGGYNGGNIYNSYLTNCTLAFNTGGGAIGGALINCVAIYNGVWNYSGTAVHFCCTTPMPGSGLGNLASDPRFLDAVAGDLRLQSDSPCINAGNNSNVTTTDLDGNPRIVGGTVDIGAYEFQSPTSLLSYAWLQQYGFPTDGSADFADTDQDGMNNWQEWVAGTDPTDPLSVLSMVSATNSPTGASVSWQSVNTRNYFIQRANDLGAQPAFATIVTNIAGQSGTTTFTDTNATGGGPWLYRVGVQQ